MSFGSWLSTLIKNNLILSMAYRSLGSSGSFPTSKWAKCFQIPKLDLFVPRSCEKRQKEPSPSQRFQLLTWHNNKTKCRSHRETTVKAPLRETNKRERLTLRRTLTFPQILRIQATKIVHIVAQHCFRFETGTLATAIFYGTWNHRKWFTFGWFLTISSNVVNFDSNFRSLSTFELLTVFAEEKRKARTERKSKILLIEV